MKASLFFLLLTCLLIAQVKSSYGQVQPMSKPPEPLYMLNSTTIANGLFARLNPLDFKKIIVYKDSAGPNGLNGISSCGIIDIVYAKPVNGESFYDIAQQQKLSGPVVFVLNGNKLNSLQLARLRIVPEAIGQLRVILHTTGGQGATVVIQTASSETNTSSDARGSKEQRVMVR